MVGLCILAVLFMGLYALPNLNKNEFPSVAINQGVVAVVYPGATAEEIEEQVTGKVEQYLFTFTDVDKTKTYSYSQNGMLYLFVSLVATDEDPKVTWSRIREGLTLFRLTDLPQGVAATAVIDDFGNASSLLLAIESDQRSPRELESICKQLSTRLRAIPEMGKISIVGDQREEIAIHMDPMKLTQYAISPSLVSTELAAHGIRTLSGKLTNDDGETLVHVSIPFGSIYDISELVVFGDPATGQIVRVRDIATVEPRYEPRKPHIEYYDSTSRGNRSVLLSVEMRSGNNVVKFGSKVEKVIADYQKTLTPDIRIHRITDQPRVVNQSVLSFLRDLLEAILVVIIVMLLLFPLKTALVSSTSVPICIAGTLAIMFFLGFELNTVTLAALIAVLGMIVDDSVVVIDGYSDALREGHSRWYAAAVSTSKLSNSMLFATMSIAAMFFPTLAIFKGNNMSDFLKLFPWTILIALSCSYLFSILVIPSVSARMIRLEKDKQPSRFERIQEGFFSGLQNGYKWLLDLCFRHKRITLAVGVLSVIAGAAIFTTINIQIFPKAERESFAVEIHLKSGMSIEKTDMVADSLARLLLEDSRVVNITSFIGMSSPRFHMMYAPQLASDNYAQFVVNTVSNDATKDLIDEWAQRYENIFPYAQIRFRQMDYQVCNSPIEFRLFGDDYDSMDPIRDTLIGIMKQSPNLFHVYSDYDETEVVADVVLKTEQATRMGITQSTLSLFLAGALSGSQISSIWEGGYSIPISVYSDGNNNLDYTSLGDMLVPGALPGIWVPLRQVADIQPHFHHINLPHRNGVRCITVSADVMPGVSQMKEFRRIEAALDQMELPEGVSYITGGTDEISRSIMPLIALAVLAAVLIMFIVLIIHYGRIGVSILAIMMSTLCVFGVAVGLKLFDADFSISATLGLISLVGIIVRNAIIMYDYVAELRSKEAISVTEAAYQAGLRRMRPIFLTSATTAIGVIPMILAHSLLWMPMGVVICFGTLISLPLVITILPVAYAVAFEGKKRTNHRPINLS